MSSTMTIKGWIGCFAVCLLALFARSAYAAWDGQVIGRVGDIFVGGTGQAYFSLENSPNLCALTGPQGGRNIGLLYVPASPGVAGNPMVDVEGGKALVALLTAAKTSGRTVTVWATNGSQWGCLVGGITIH